MSIRLLACALALAACAPAASPDAPGSADASEDDLSARARAAGLTAAQADQLVALGVPVAVPGLPAGWRLDSLKVETTAPPAHVRASYSLEYRRADGACFSISGEQGALGADLADEPSHERAVPVPGLAMDETPRLVWNDTEGRGPPYVFAGSWFDSIQIVLYSSEYDGCTRIGPDEGAAVLASLRYLDPAADATLIGHFADVRPPLTVGSDPEVLARTLFAADEGEGTTATVETLRLRPRHAVVLVTNTNLADDSVRDERMRVVLLNWEETPSWFVASVGRQVRCREGRGHQDWSPEPCL